MNGKSAIVLLACFAAFAAAMPRDTQTQYEFEPIKESDSDSSSGWRTWNAVRNWLSPATNYITQSLPDKTPSEFASDVRQTAVDLRDRARDHPVVQGVSNVVRPVHQWVSDAASELSKTSFRDMYDRAASSVRTADERFADWLNRRSAEQQLEQYNYQMPQAEGVEQILH